MTRQHPTAALFGKTPLLALAHHAICVVSGKMATWAVGGVLLLLGTASAPVIAVASIGAFVAEGSAGGILGSTLGKEFSDGIYSLYELAIE